MLLEVPKELRVGNTWVSDPKNLENLRLFLSRHGVDINNTVALFFRRDGFSVEAFVRDDRGRVQASEQGVVTRIKSYKYIGRKPRLV